MFRIPDRCALINRMGFNNKGVDHLVARMSRSRYRGIRGISIGKNFDTPIENAQDDYLTCLRKVYVHADYVAVNISSPNTARLRELQAPDALQRILGALLEERALQQQRYGKRVPLLVKVAPDLGPEQISAIAADLRALEIDGVIATNTSIGRDGLRRMAVAAQPPVTNTEPCAPTVMSLQSGRIPGSGETGGLVEGASLRCEWHHVQRRHGRIQ
jgi:dihydroorotate dehydrogenase